MTPTTKRPPIQIPVRIGSDGIPNCGDKEVIRAQRGDRLQWTGAEHRGVFRGKITGPKMDNITPDDLRKLKFTTDKTKMPSNSPNWSNGAIVEISATAEKGAYKYSIFVGSGANEKELDPIVIIDDDPSR